MMHQEHKLQQQLAAWFDSHGILHCASIGGVNTGVRVGALMKAKGYRKGFPDHMIFEPRAGYHGCFIEIKVQNTKKSPYQERWHEELRKKGYYVIVVPGKYDFWEARRYLETEIETYLRGKV